MEPAVPETRAPRSSVLEQALSQPFRAVRLDSIRNKILAFALLATLIPSLSTTWLSYSQNKRSLQDKINHELQNVSTETAREMDLWLKERLYDLRVFASSYEVSENLDRASQSGSKTARRLNDYLNSVRERFTDYEELVAVDRDGHVVASSAAQARPITLPSTWQHDMRAGNPSVGDPYWDEARKKVLVVATVPIRHASGRMLGALAARVNLRSVDDMLKRFSPEPAGQSYLITAEGNVITSSSLGSATPMTNALPTATAQELVRKEATTTEYRSFNRASVVGTLREVPRLNWSVVAEVPTAEAYRQVRQLRNETALIVLTLLAGVGLIAYFLGLLIVRPLNRLTRGAALVAAGDLDVDLPVTGGGEVGYLTEVFNNMVARLRESRKELERLSVTDALTKLYNRRYLHQTLTEELQRCVRHKRALAVVMVDVDHFKRFNDTYGHLAGDSVLARVAAILQEATRDVDCAARYGGEEFVLLLTETGLDGAIEVTERIRARLAKEDFQGGKVTLSIGVAEFPTHGDTPEGLIGSADAALYKAKQDGRDRVARAVPARRSKETKERA